MDLRCHRWRMYATKCILTVICLSLFTAQASYKYYQSSSLSFIYYYKNCVCSKTHPDKTSGISHFHARSRIKHSLDKRYSLTQLFPYPPAAPAIAAFPLAAREKLPLPFGGINSPSIGSAAERGPPAA